VNKSRKSYGVVYIEKLASGLPFCVQRSLGVLREGLDKVRQAKLLSRSSGYRGQGTERGRGQPRASREGPSHGRGVHANRCLLCFGAGGLALFCLWAGGP
jgi:hypothetical protein